MRKVTLMGRSRNKHKTWMAHSGEASGSNPYRAFPRTSDGVVHPVQISVAADKAAQWWPPLTDAYGQAVYLDNDGAIICDD